MIHWTDQAIVLSKINLTETSIILKVFTRSNGIRKGIVKGAKNKKKLSCSKREIKYILSGKEEQKTF